MDNFILYIIGMALCAGVAIYFYKKEKPEPPAPEIKKSAPVEEQNQRGEVEQTSRKYVENTDRRDFFIGAVHEKMQPLLEESRRSGNAPEDHDPSIPWILQRTKDEVKKSGYENDLVISNEELKLLEKYKDSNLAWIIGASFAITENGKLRVPLGLVSMLYSQRKPLIQPDGTLMVTDLLTLEEKTELAIISGRPFLARSEHSGKILKISADMIERCFTHLSVEQIEHAENLTEAFLEREKMIREEYTVELNALRGQVEQLKIENKVFAKSADLNRALEDQVVQLKTEKQQLSKMVVELKQHLQTLSIQVGPVEAAAKHEVEHQSPPNEMKKNAHDAGNTKDEKCIMIDEESNTVKTDVQEVGLVNRAEAKIPQTIENNLTHLENGQSNYPQEKETHTVKENNSEALIEQESAAQEQPSEPQKPKQNKTGCGKASITNNLIEHLEQAKNSRHRLFQKAGLLCISESTRSGECVFTFEPKRFDQFLSLVKERMGCQESSLKWNYTKIYTGSMKELSDTYFSGDAIVISAKSTMPLDEHRYALSEKRYEQDSDPLLVRHISAITISEKNQPLEAIFETNAYTNSKRRGE